MALQWQRTDLAKRVLDTSGPQEAHQKVDELKDKFIKVLVDPVEEMSFITLFLEAAGQKELIKVRLLFTWPTSVSRVQTRI